MRRAHEREIFLTRWSEMQMKGINYFPVPTSGCVLPTSFLMCMAKFVISSLSKYLKLRYDVWYPTIFSASLSARFHSFLVSVFTTIFSCTCDVVEMWRAHFVRLYEDRAIKLVNTFFAEHKRLNDISLMIFFPLVASTQNFKFSKKNFFFFRTNNLLLLFFRTIAIIDYCVHFTKNFKARTEK